MLKLDDIPPSFVALLDSGLGGLMTLAQSERLAPGERFVYVADFANAPYGEKSPEQVSRIVSRHADDLVAKGARALVLACNTATSAAVSDLRARLDIPVIGMEPALKPAAERHPGGRVLVMATPLTLRERKFRDLLEKVGRNCHVEPLACPGLAAAIDAGDLAAAGDLARKTLETFPPAREADAIVLGCSHYAFVAEAVRSWRGATIPLYDGALGTARRLVSILEERAALDPSSAPSFQQTRIICHGAAPEKSALAEEYLRRARALTRKSQYL